MTALVLVLSDGRIFICRTPRQGWQDSGLRLREFAQGTVQLQPIDALSFCLRRATPDGQFTGEVLSVGQFALSREGKLILRMHPLLPPGITSVRAISHTGQRLFVSYSSSTPYVPAYTVLEQVGNGWRPVFAKTPLTKRYRDRGRERSEDPEVFASFDRSGQLLCLSLTFRLMVNANHSWLFVHRIERSGLKRIWPVQGPTESESETGQILPTDTGWFIETSDAVYPLQLSPRANPRKVGRGAEHRGRLVGPAIGSDITIAGEDGMLRFAGRPVGKASVYNQGANLSPLFYWPGVGAVWLRGLTPEGEATGKSKGRGIYLNDKPFPAPPTGQKARLFLIWTSV